MDRNQIIGLLIIGAILLIYSIYSSPNEEEIAAAKKRRDSIAKVEAKIQKKRIEEEKKRTQLLKDTINIVKSDSLSNDSTKAAMLKDKYGIFSASIGGENKFITIENDLVKLRVSTKGGKPYSVELKDYKRHDMLPLKLFDGEQNKFGLKFFAQNRSIITNDMFFSFIGDLDSISAINSKKSIKLRLSGGEGKYIEYVYTLKPDSYLVDFKINIVGLNNIIQSNTKYMDFEWYVKVLSLEKGHKWENDNTTIYYKYYKDEVDYLTETSDDEKENLSTKVKWVAYKQQFFSTILIANSYFSNGTVSHKKIESPHKYLKDFNTQLSIPFSGDENESIPFTFYFGPNKYSVLKDLKIENENEDLNLKSLIPLGWGVFGWVNRFAIIPLFNFLGTLISSYGLLILVMTLIIKLVLFPLTYKSYTSSAKMRVLKPQIDEINKKIPKEKAMERQQATMALYKKVGVNPMGGCLPMALQFPILIAMFRFFPASIELRQESFLWVTDLSTYDSILDLSFEIPMYGDHVSLFTLLMAISMVFSTKLNGNQMGTANTQMPGMKMMMYMMPVMMILWFNNYSAGLSYYYLLSNLITIAQTFIIRAIVNDEEILKKLKASKKKPAKKSKFQKRLEDMAKKKGYNLKK